MKLLSCYIENFGKLHKYTHTFCDGLNVFEKENGWGKSTLAAFIKAMLYGLPASRSTDLDENERKRYLPWNAEVCGGSLSFEVNGSRYRAERIFAKRESADVFRLFSIDTGLPSDDYSAALGCEIFGIDRDGYERSTYLSCKQLAASGYSTIQSALSNQNDLTCYDAAIAVLDRRRKHYQMTGKRGKVAELSESLHAQQRLLENAEADREALRALSAELIDAEQRIDCKQKDRERLLVLAERAKAQGSARQVEETASRLLLACERARAEHDGLRSVFGAELPSEAHVDEMLAESREIDAEIKKREGTARVREKSTVKRRKISLSALLLSLCLPVPCVLLGAPVLAIAAGVLALACTVSLLLQTPMRGKKNTERQQDTLRERMEKRSRFLSCYTDLGEQDETARILYLKERLSALSLAQERLHMAQQTLADFRAVHPEQAPEESDGTCATQSPEELLESAKRLAEEIQQDRARLLEKQHRARELEESAAKIPKHASYLAFLAEEKRTAEQNLSAILRARELLGVARGALTLRYRDTVESAFRKYLAELDASEKTPLLSEGDVATVSGGFEMSLTCGALTHGVSAFSSGYRDLLALCLRFSICDALLASESAPMILDDPFNNLDDRKTRVALQLLHRLCRDRQILYFTCSHSRTPICDAKQDAEQK